MMARKHYHIHNHKRPDRITCDYNTDRILKSTILFITELLKIKLGTAFDVSLIGCENRLELCFLYKARCYNPMIEDADPENPLELFFKQYYNDIAFSYDGKINKLLFTYIRKEKCE